MLNAHKLVLLIFTLTAVLHVQAQEEWTLEECINYALQNNLAQQSYLLSEQTATINAQQAKLNLLPSISASSSAGISFGRSVDESSYDIVNEKFLSNSNSVSSSVSIFHGFIQLNQIAYNKFREKSAHWQKINNQDNLSFSILTAYYDVIYFKGMVEIAQEQVELSTFNLKKTETQIETGLKARMDLAEMQSSYEKEKLNLLQAENKLTAVKLQLGQLMNLPADRLVTIEIKDAEPMASSNLGLASDSLFDSFVQQSPFVKIAEANLQAAAKNVAITRGYYFPSVGLNASIGTNYSEAQKSVSFSQQFKNNLGQYVGASISIPIFSKNQVRNEVRKAKLDKQQAQTQLDTYRQSLEYELANNSRELNSLFSEYYQTEKQLHADELSYRVAERKYNEGLIDVIQLLTVKQRLATTKSQHLLARLQYEIKDKVIDFYKGIRFWEE